MVSVFPAWSVPAVQKRSTLTGGIWSAGIVTSNSFERSESCSLAIETRVSAMLRLNASAEDPPSQPASTRNWYCRAGNVMKFSLAGRVETITVGVSASTDNSPATAATGAPVVMAVLTRAARYLNCNEIGMSKGYVIEPKKQAVNRHRSSDFRAAVSTTGK